MSGSKDDIKSDLVKVDAYVLTPADYEEIPELTDEFFHRGILMRDGVQIKRGRPVAEHPKKSVTMRLDADVVAHFRETGAGWQSRINAILRGAANLAAKK